MFPCITNHFLHNASVKLQRTGVKLVIGALQGQQLFVLSLIHIYQITASVENGYLTVTAAKGLDKDEDDKNGRYVRRERWAGQCSRSFYVGEGITDADVHAKFEDGILRLSIPKAEQKALPEKTYIAIE